MNATKAADLHWKRRAAKYVAVGLCLLFSVAWVQSLFDTKYSYNNAPRADLAVRTPYLLDVAAHLEQDPVHVDPVLAPNLGAEIVTEKVRAAVARSEVPVRLVVAPMYSGDGTAGNARVFLARLAEELDQDGIYLLLDQNRFARYYFRGLRIEGLSGNAPVEPQTAVSLARSIDQVSKIAVEGQKFRIFPVIYGVAVGVMLSIGLWYLIWLVRWSMRRNRSYLEGFE